MASELVLVDTSAWTRFFRKKPDSPAAADEVERLLGEGLACWVRPIYLELLVGARGKDGVDALEASFSALRRLDAGDREWDEAASIASSLRKKGLRVDVVDLVVAASAITNGVSLFHHDRHFKQIAGVAALRERSFLE